MDGQHSTLAKLGLAALACNSALAVYNSWGDAGSVAFVLAADAALVLLFLCLRQFERARARRGGGGARWARVDMDRRSALAAVLFAVLACNTAIDTYSARRDAGSAAFVAVAYVGLVATTGHFLRTFARAGGGGQGHGQDQAGGVGAADAAGHGGLGGPADWP
ncbi:hypothetical protein ACP70R_041865 [Stipagrostis hirtigluma subsp. patula]